LQIVVSKRNELSSGVLASSSIWRLLQFWIFVLMTSLQSMNGIRNPNNDYFRYRPDHTTTRPSTILLTLLFFLLLTQFAKAECLSLAHIAVILAMLL
jgi:succinate dehydrogenase hydrophobic anchor subunit